ncbi:MAG: tRNA threonylcarbamoyladenosine dehydratase [Bdellovibrio sp.]|nr:tRNA threonylcarbamoyladenosine dehydratase [Bdellovibrio sp.]
MIQTEHHFRFAGIARLYGEIGLKKLARAHVLIVGLGGVGSWAIEACARSGIGEFTLVDFDEICVTNTNRQIHATIETIGQSKVSVMAERIKNINPEARVYAIQDAFNENNADAILKSYDFVLDAIDSLKYKLLLYYRCQERKLPLLITGAAGGKRDPRMIQVQDLGLSYNDNLLFRMRKKLRREDQLMRGRKKFGVDCVFSNEKALYPDECEAEPQESSLKLDCEGAVGSAAFLTGAFGLLAAHHIVEKICQK